jgi:hypothetical protein
MATWNGVITNAGNSLLNEWVNEKTLNFDSAAAGQGTVAAAAMMAQTALVNEKQTASLLGGERVSSGIRLKLRIAAPNTAYTLNQFRVSASVDGGASAMIALFQLEQGVPIPSKTESPDFVYTFYALISCSNTGTWTVTVDTSACVTQGDMSAAIAEAVKTKQDKIMVKGLLLGDGNGNISAAVAGKDYGYPLATGSGAPTDTTEGTAGQHYYDSATGKEYVCSGKDSSGKYRWKLSGASDAADLTYNGESLDTFLDGVSVDLDTLSKGLDGSKPLTGTTDPTSSTKGSVGQSYLNTDTMQTFYCTAANDQTGVYTWEKPKGGGVAPQLEVSVATGSAITCTNGETTLTGTSVGGKCVFDLPGYGTWSLYATLNGQTTATETVVVDQVKQYTVTLSYFAATLTVTAESGAVVTATLGTKQYTGTCGSNGKCALTVNYAGTYSVTATKSGVSSSTASASVSTSGGSYTATVKFCTLTVTIDSGSTVKAVNGSTTLTATSNGTAKFYLPNTGTWSVTATKNGETATGSVACSSYTGYTLELSYVKVFGVCWNYSAQSTVLTRLTKSNDPNGLVNVNITTNPSPAVGTGAGSSPFDSYLPWSGMDEYNIINNAVSYKKGQSGFSRSNYDTVVFIPEYYFRIIDDAANKKRYFYIADKAKSGFTKHPGSGKYVGRYNTISGYYSKTGSQPLANMTRATARTNSKNKGSKWGQYDFASWCAVWLLYLVEFADWNSQATIGVGICNGSSMSNTGGTDGMSYHTGTAASSRTATGAVQYRNIENPYGNIWEWIDGVNFSDGTVYVCTTPANYADDTTAGYTNAGTKVQSNGFIKAIGLSGTAPWAFFPTEVGGSETIYIPDYAYYYSGWRVLMVGGVYGNSTGYVGLFYFGASNASSSSGSSVGARLLFHP